MGQEIICFDEQVIVFFLDSFDHVFTRNIFRIAIQKISWPCLPKILSMTLFTHYSLFLHNILDSANKTFIGETVTFCSWHYSLIGLWYSGNMYVCPTVLFHYYKAHIEFIIFHGFCCTYQETQLEQCTTEETKLDL